jgi:nucleoid-associated protein YgaU
LAELAAVHATLTATRDAEAKAQVELQSQVAQLSERLAATATENAALNERLAAQGDPAKETVTLNNRITQLTNHATDMGRQLAGLKRRNQELEELAERRSRILAEAQQTLAENQEELSALAEAQQRFQAEISANSSARQLADRLAAELATAQIAADEALAQTNGLEVRLADVTANNMTLAQQLATAEASLRATTDSERDRVTEARRADAHAFAALQQQHLELQATLEKTLAENSALTARLDRTEPSPDTETQLAALTAARAEALTAAEATRLENETLQASLSVALNARTAAEQALAETSTELAALRVSAAKASAAELDSLQQQLHEAVTAGRELAAKNQALEEIASDRGRSLEAIQQSLSEARSGNATLEAQLAALTVANTTLEQRLAARPATTPNDSTRRQLAEQNRTIEQLGANLAATRAANEQARQQAAEADAALERLNARQAELASRLESASAREADLTRRLATAEQTLTARTGDSPAMIDIRQELAATNSKLSTALASYSQLQRENKQLLAARATAEQASRALADERTALQQQLAERSAHREPETVAPVVDTGALSAIEERLATALRSFSLLQDEHDRLKATADRLANEKASLETQLSGAGNVNTQLAGQLTTVSATAAEAETLRTQLRQMQDQINAVSAENTQLRTRLAVVAAQPVPGLAVPSRPSTVPTRPTITPPAEPVATPPEAAPEPRFHTVVAGDTLTRIAREYYGTSLRWPEILEANRSQLNDERSLRVGQRLRIP